jgi:sec-independent protein translocase protein TatA
MFGLTPVHLIIILVVALLVFGPGKLPETGAALGKAIRDFRNAASGDVEESAPSSPAAHVAPDAAAAPSPQHPDKS